MINTLELRDEILKRLTHRFPNRTINTLELRDEILKKVVYRPVAKKGTGLLDGIPHVSFLDIAFAYRFTISDNENGRIGFDVRDRVCEIIGLGLDELDRAARRNTEAGGFEVEAIRQHFAEIAEQEGLAVPGAYNRDFPMWVLTNADSFNGAAVLLYPGYFARLANEAGGDLYVMPSSIHEVLAVPVGIAEPGELRLLVNTINATELMEDEVLSSSVYRYSRYSGEIVIA